MGLFNSSREKHLERMLQLANNHIELLQNLVETYRNASSTMKDNTSLDTDLFMVLVKDKDKRIG